MVKLLIEYEGDMMTRCVHEPTGEELYTDLPVDAKGKGRNFSPTDLVGVALGSCILTLMGIVAAKLNLDITGTTVAVEKEMKSAPARMIGKITLHIVCPRSFDPTATQQLEKAARNCPVHHSLHPDIVQEWHFQWGDV